MILLLSTMLLVFLRAFQQLNVIHHHMILAGCTSYGIAIAEVAVVLNVIDLGWWSVPWMGTGGAVGVMLAMVFHKQLRGILNHE